MNYINQTSDSFMESLNNAYGSKKNFEHELIHKAFENGNKGKIYFAMNRYCNFFLKKNLNTNTDYTLLTCNLDYCDIYNFIEDIDYSKLSKAYHEIKRLIQSK